MPRDEESREYFLDPDNPPPHGVYSLHGPGAGLDIVGLWVLRDGQCLILVDPRPDVYPGESFDIRRNDWASFCGFFAPDFISVLRVIP